VNEWEDIIEKFDSPECQYLRGFYEREKEEIGEDEEVIAVTKIGWSVISIVILTDKLLRIRYCHANGEVLESIDIPLSDIDEHKIAKWGKRGWRGIILIHNGKKYRIVNTSREIKDNSSTVMRRAFPMPHVERMGRLYEILIDAIKKSREVKLSGKYIGKIIQIGGIHIDGIPFLGGKEVLLNLYSDKLIISDKNKKNSYKIQMENIVDMKIKTETEISEQERHVLARAVAGGLLFGGVGAIVGAVSGVPGKQIKTTHNFLIVDYLSRDGEQKSMMFLYKGANKKPLENLVNAVFEIKGKKQSEDGEEVEL